MSVSRQSEVSSNLVIAAKAGSSVAFDALVRMYRSRVVRIAFALTRDRDEANDIAQEVFLRALGAIHRFESDRSFLRWLLVIARNTAIDSIRRRNRSAVLIADWPITIDFSSSPEVIVLQNYESSLMQNALATLPARYRDVLELYYFKELRYREIAVELDVPIGTIKTWVARAKLRLRDELDEMDQLVSIR